MQTLTCSVVIIIVVPCVYTCISIIYLLFIESFQCVVAYIFTYIVRHHKSPDITCGDQGALPCHATAAIEFETAFDGKEELTSDHSIRTRIHKRQNVYIQSGIEACI